MAESWDITLAVGSLLIRARQWRRYFRLGGKRPSYERGRSFSRAKYLSDEECQETERNRPLAVGAVTRAAATERNVFCNYEELSKYYSTLVWVLRRLSHFLYYSKQTETRLSL